MFRMLFGLRKPNRQRDVYEYWDGEQVRAIDPLMAYRALLAHPKFDWDVHPAMIDNMDSDISEIRKEAVAASEVTCNAIRDVFGLKPWTESQPGLTESETIRVLVMFVDWLVGQKKNPSRSPISPEPTDQTQSGVLHAMVSVLGSGKMSKEWIRAFSENSEEAEAAYNRHTFTRSGSGSSSSTPWDGAFQG